MYNPNEYVPNPIDTSDVVLPPEVDSLIEKLAENTHEVWAKNRQKQGWTFGFKRDDAKKETPCMLPYEMLDDSEKEYDRATAYETLALICKLGYKIVKADE
jgi:ryanodine receptor 2